MPSRLDNSPYVVLECLDNAVPFIATDVGGVAELIHPDDRARALVSENPEEIADRLLDALQNGVAPVRPSFDPALADIDLLALHANLVAEARASRGRAVRQRAAGDGHRLWPEGRDRWRRRLAEWLARVGGASIEVLVCANSGCRSVGAQRADVERRSTTRPRTSIFSSATPRRFPMRTRCAQWPPRSIDQDADAAVCGYRMRYTDGTVRRNRRFRRARRNDPREPNVYGARLFLVRKAAFLAAGGFSDQPDIVDILEWEFLNRLKAAGRKIAAVPIALGRVRCGPRRHRNCRSCSRAP